jgi:hypothetical protein
MAGAKTVRYIFLAAIIQILAENGAIMHWARILAYVTGTVHQELLGAE